MTHDWTKQDGLYPGLWDGRRTLFQRWACARCDLQRARLAGLGRPLDKSPSGSDLPPDVELDCDEMVVRGVLES